MKSGEVQGGVKGFSRGKGCAYVVEVEELLSFVNEVQMEEMSRVPDSKPGVGPTGRYMARSWLQKACIDATPKAGPEQNGFDILASGGAILSPEAY